MLDKMKEFFDASKPEQAPPPSRDGAADEFDPSEFSFEAHHSYRVTFKNGLSSECDGAALANAFPFDPAQVERIEKTQHIGGPAKEAA